MRWCWKVPGCCTCIMCILYKKDTIIIYMYIYTYCILLCIYTLLFGDHKTVAPVHNAATPRWSTIFVGKLSLVCRSGRVSLGQTNGFDSSVMKILKLLPQDISGFSFSTRMRCDQCKSLWATALFSLESEGRCDSSCARSMRNRRILCLTAYFPCGKLGTMWGSPVISWFINTINYT